VDPVRRLIAELDASQPATFPYDEVITEFHRVGKHFVSTDLLAALDAVRRRLPAERDQACDRLGRFLDCALDKWEGRYDYVSYIGLSLLDLPAGDDAEEAATHRDRIVLLLVTDALAFELLAAQDQVSLLPRMRPDACIVAKRCRLGLRCLPPGACGPDAACTVAAVRSGQRPDETLMLRLSMLPVDIIHDEYLFIRVLQSFEATFALIVVHLEAAIRSLSARRAVDAADQIAAAETVLQRSAPLFSLLATMQVASFQSFRQYTTGASAIQSRNYKRFEALCRMPDDTRLDSPAYRSVPEIRQEILAGVSNIDLALRTAMEADWLTRHNQGLLLEAMDRFAATLTRWRKTHYRLAVRMLGERPGTGRTAGTPYLRDVVHIPVFTTATGDAP
jgi:tryptophan 2,3-dioxygenase